MRKRFRHYMLLLLDLLYPHGKSNAAPKHPFKFFHLF